MCISSFHMAAGQSYNLTGQSLASAKTGKKQLLENWNTCFLLLVIFSYIYFFTVIKMNLGVQGYYNQ